LPAIIACPRRPRPPGEVEWKIELIKRVLAIRLALTMLSSNFMASSRTLSLLKPYRSPLLDNFRTLRRIEHFPQLANELASLNLDLILAPNTPAARAVQRATRTIPIVVPVMGDPVEDGLVASLARPGGNITGLTFLGPEIVPKRLGLLKQALPNVSRVAALWHPGAFGERTTRDMLQATEAAARTLAIELQLVEVRAADEFDRAFSAMTGNRADAVIVFPSTLLFTERKHIADLATKHRLPSIAQAREFAELGGLMGYGASIADLQRRGATYVDKISVKLCPNGNRWRRADYDRFGVGKGPRPPAFQSEEITRKAGQPAVGIDREEQGVAAQVRRSSARCQSA